MNSSDKEKNSHKLIPRAKGPYVEIILSDSNIARIADMLKMENDHAFRLKTTSPTEADQKRLMVSELIKNTSKYEIYRYKLDK